MEISNEMIKNSLVYQGDTTKLSRVLEDAKKGKDIKIAFLGGSITQGCNATSYSNCYAYKTYLWFKEKFNNSAVKYINAGVGATGSIIGVHRVEKQVIAEKPDIVFIDFAVNDKYDKYDRIAYESLIRRLLALEKVPAIIEVFMSNYNGLNVQDQQILIGKKYNIPMISYRDAIFSQIFTGKLTWKDVGTDEVHPNDYGHAIIVKLLTSFIEQVYNSSNKNKPQKINLGQPLFGDKFVNGTILNNKNNIVIENEGFEEDSTGFQVFNNGWTFKAKNGGTANLTLKTKGCNIFLLYKMRTEEDAGVIDISVNGKQVKKIDTFFKDGWGDYSNTELLVENDSAENHIIKITVESEKKDVEVSIMGLLVS